MSTLLTRADIKYGGVYKTLHGDALTVLSIFTCNCPDCTVYEHVRVVNLRGAQTVVTMARLLADVKERLA